MTFSTKNFDPLTPLAPKFPNLDEWFVKAVQKDSFAEITQKRNKTANINVKIAVYAQVNGEWHI